MGLLHGIVGDKAVEDLSDRCSVIQYRDGIAESLSDRRGCRATILALWNTCLIDSRCVADPSG